ncbi:CBS domain-containing protein [Candidatus Thalassolituus haligoni]|uniref:CBS domain-containing protein n=1 Tax=Candidatus Thalassolituus haligoni TaxID=3100113 RepID=UPI003511CC8C|tara:strand:- start:1002 stop:1616 length:615 start_codon:yes stop_codon:yes gene_type:complete
MAIISFDMGQRVITPEQPTARKVERTGAISPASALHQHTGSETTPAGHNPPRNPAIHRYQQQARQQDNTPRPVLYVAELMTVSPTTLPATATLEEAWLCLREHPFRHLPVVTEQRIQGLLSDRDLLTYYASPDQHQSTATLMSIASRPVMCVEAHTDIRQAAALLCEQHIGCLPVVEHELITGILTRSDCLRALSRYPEITLWV